MKTPPKEHLNLPKEKLPDSKENSTHKLYAPIPSKKQKLGYALLVELNLGSPHKSGPWGEPKKDLQDNEESEKNNFRGPN